MVKVIGYRLLVIGYWLLVYDYYLSRRSGHGLPSDKRKDAPGDWLLVIGVEDARRRATGERGGKGER